MDDVCLVEENLKKEFELLKAKKIVGETSEDQYNTDMQKLSTRLSEINERKSSLTS